MENITSIDPSDLSLKDRHGLLLSAVAPRPICFASTIDKAGNINLSPFSFFNVFSSNPPIMVFSPARSGRDNTTKHTHANILEVKEVVINIVNYPIVQQMSLASTAYDKGVNEFSKSGLTPVPSTVVKPPRVAESPVAFECVVEQIIELGQQGGAGNLIIARVVLMHIHNRFLDAAGKLDTKKLDLVARMGGNWYCHAKEDALFEIPKPGRVKGIGVDVLPASARNSKVLSGNDLGLLGGLPAVPSKSAIEAIGKDASVLEIVEKEPLDGIEQLHKLAISNIVQGNLDKALAIIYFAASPPQ